MPADAIVITAVGLPPELRALVKEAARSAWPQARVVERASAAEVDSGPLGPGVELAVVGAGVAPEERSRLVAAVGLDGLPRWPVVALGGDGVAEGILVVPEELRTAGALRFVFTTAMHLHAVLRQARRSEGDLRTVARRISHEIRSPIGCILTSADVIREEMEELVPAAVELARPVIDSARDVMSVVERLTLIARASSQHGVLMPVEMGMSVWAAQERIRSTLHETGATITEVDDWPSAQGKPEWVEQIWLNFLTNAARHGGPRPQIEIGWTRRDGELRFHVRDDGPGVPSDLIPRLFQPFHTLYQNDSGRGLGLAIVQRLVELQGGRVGYEAVQPRGACFFFTLPEAPPDRAGPGIVPGT